MKTAILITVLIFSVFIAHAQKQEDYFPKKNISKNLIVLLGEVSLSFFESEVSLSLTIVNEEITIISFEENKEAHNPISGQFFLDNITDSLEMNRVRFNNQKIEQLLRVFVSPNFNSTQGGMIYFDIFSKDSWGNILIFDIQKKDRGEYQTYFIDLSHEKINRIKVEWIEIKLNFSLFIKECSVNRAQKKILIFSN